VPTVAGSNGVFLVLVGEAHVHFPAREHRFSAVMSFFTPAISSKLKLNRARDAAGEERLREGCARSGN
jgi:hypothetical protein